MLPCLSSGVDLSISLVIVIGLCIRLPAGTCRVGARYPTAELGTGNRVYRMTNVVVASCSVSGHGGDSSARPMESMSLNYEKVVWN